MGFICNWFKGLFHKKPLSLITPEIEDLALQLTIGATTDEERLLAIYNYITSKKSATLQDPDKYAWLTPEQVIGKIAKDEPLGCKHKAVLFLALAQAAGLQNRVRFIGGRIRFPNGEEYGHAWINLCPGEWGRFELMHLEDREPAQSIPEAMFRIPGGWWSVVYIHPRELGLATAFDDVDKMPQLKGKR